MALSRKKSSGVYVIDTLPKLKEQWTVARELVLKFHKLKNNSGCGILND